jgi:hypothetical protein
MVQNIRQVRGVEDGQLPKWETESGVVVAEVYTWNSGMWSEPTSLIYELRDRNDKLVKKDGCTPKSQKDGNQKVEEYRQICLIHVQSL